MFTCIRLYKKKFYSSNFYFIPFLVQYAFILMSVFALEFVIGGVSYIYETQIDDELLNTLNTTFMTSYGIDEGRTVAIDSMQQNVSFKLKCG